METQFKDGIVKYILSRTDKAKLVPIIIDYELYKGAGLLNPSVFVHNNQILVNLRQTNYTLYHSENKRFAHQWGPLQYLHPENDQTLRTKNWLLFMSDDLDITKVMPIDTSELDQKPIWHFIGLEDVRLFNWDNKFYICGVRRDDNTKGSGRMQLQEIEIGYEFVKEVSRHKIPAPGTNLSYCEKNWMPITDKPYHFVKWTNPTEVVYFDINDGSTKTVILDESKTIPLPNDLRGSSQVVPYNDGYLAITHEVNLFTDIQGRKDGKYRHRFVYWDKNFNILKTSEMFHFMTGEIEFCAGMAIHNDSILMTYGFQDNAAYMFKMPIEFLNELLQ